MPNLQSPEEKAALVSMIRTTKTQTIKTQQTIQILRTTKAISWITLRLICQQKDAILRPRLCPPISFVCMNPSIYSFTPLRSLLPLSSSPPLLRGAHFDWLLHQTTENHPLRNNRRLESTTPPSHHDLSPPFYQPQSSKPSIAPIVEPESPESIQRGIISTVILLRHR